MTDKLFGFTPVYFRNLKQEEYLNIKDIITMDSYILALTHSGYLYINEGGTTFTDMGLNVDYFSNPSNLIVNIFATSYSFFIRTRSGEVYYVEQGLSKMVKSSLLSFKSFNPSAGRYHLASISTNTHDYGLFEVIGYNKVSCMR